MKKWLIIGSLLALSVVCLVAFAQNTPAPAPFSGEPAAVAMGPQGMVQGGHLIVLRGSTLSVYNVRRLPDIELVNAVQVPSSLGEATAIMAAHRAEARKPADPASVDGRKVYDTLQCSKCHRLQGKGGTIGPDLSHEGSRHDATWIEKKVTDPKATNKNSIMPAQQLPKDQLDALGQYLAGLK